MFTTQIPILRFTAGSLLAALKIYSYEQNSFQGGLTMVVCPHSSGSRTASCLSQNCFRSTVISPLEHLRQDISSSHPSSERNCRLPRPPHACSMSPHQFEGPVCVLDRSLPPRDPLGGDCLVRCPYQSTTHLDHGDSTFEFWLSPFLTRADRRPLLETTPPRIRVR